MSMAFAGLDILLPVLQALGRKLESRLLCLGTQDLAFTYEQARAFMQGKGIPVVEVPPAECRTTDTTGTFMPSCWARCALAIRGRKSVIRTVSR